MTAGGGGPVGLSPAGGADLQWAALAEGAGLNASATPRARWLDGWLMRFSPGKARRARCINALAPGRLPLEDKITRAALAYAEAGLPMLLRITPFTEPRGLDEALGGLGWRAFEATRVMLASLDDARLDAAARLPDGMALTTVGPAAFAEAVGTLRGSPAADRAGHAERLRDMPVPFRTVALMRDGEPLACAQSAREADLVGLYDVITAPAARGQGLATALCATLLLRARAEGARQAYLQVGAENAPAQSVYRRLGFVDAYGYHYRSADPLAE